MLFHFDCYLRLKFFPALKPSFKKRPLETETYAAEGGNVTIICSPEAAPRPKFTWKKDNLVIGKSLNLPKIH